MADGPKRPRDTFVDHLAHDLRNPLNTVLMSASLLGRAPELTDAHKKTVERLARAAERLVDMIGPLAELARLFLVGPMQLERRPAQLHDLCRQVVRELEAEHPGRILFDGTGTCQGSWD